MRFCFAEFMLAISYALDCVEQDLIGVATHHSKRVAYLCLIMGRKLGWDEKRLSDLAAYAVLHDNALTEYIQAEYLSTGSLKPQLKGGAVGIHCSFGERNIKNFPFFHPADNVILYHHENADGSGPFGRTAEQIPFYAALIHLADQLDAVYRLNQWNGGKLAKIVDYLTRNTGKLFAEREVSLFLAAFPDEQSFADLQNTSVDAALAKNLTYFTADYTPDQLMHLAGIFARIIDYKSTFTSLHSMGIAHKAAQMANFYGCDEEMRAKLFLAGAFHDIGKLATDIDILEKPGRLTEEEFVHIQQHAVRSWEILSGVRGFEEIARWASLHHEKLNGSGYPFGYGAAELGFYERLIGCLDIYQALCENRPYKKGKSHLETMEIMEEMVNKGFIDKSIVADIDQAFAAQ